MGLVFVHGIGNRSESGSYQEQVALRDHLFRKFLLAQALPELVDTHIHNPMWGDFGARLRWRNASSPRGHRERLGSVDEALSNVAEILNAEPGQALAGLARTNVSDAVDLLYTVADLRGRSAEEIADLADLAAVLVDYCAVHPASPNWLDRVRDDEQLLDQLYDVTTTATTTAGRDRLGGRERIGKLAFHVLADGLARFRRQQLGQPARLAAAGLRRLTAEPLSLLVGDVFAYLTTRGTRQQPGEIVQVVAGELDQARADGPLVVVAHSMGGNIVYDILSHFRQDLEVDLLVTVGSQVGLFEELALFHSSDAAIPNAAVARVPAPPNIRRWINVVDRADILAYRADPIFMGAIDYEYPSNEPWAHSAYFRQPMFHKRLAVRVREAMS